jgi:hypothetical protein
MKVPALPSRRIMIACPTYDGKVDLRFAHSLAESYQLSSAQGRDGDMLMTSFMPHDALIQNARNGLVQFALDNEVDILVWADADVYWHPMAFWQLVNSPYPFIGGLVKQKTPEGRVCIRELPEKPAPGSDGALEVRGIGCGFTKLERSVFEPLYRAATAYRYGGQTRHMLYEVCIDSLDVDEAGSGLLTSEDLAVCDKWRAAGGHVYADTTIGCGHVGGSMLHDFHGEEPPAEIVQ